MQTQDREDISEQYRRAGIFVAQLFQEDQRSCSELDTICFLMKLIRARAMVVNATIDHLEVEQIASKTNKRWAKSETARLRELLDNEDADDDTIVITEALVRAAREAVPDRTYGSVSAKLYEVRNARAAEREAVDTATGATVQI